MNKMKWGVVGTGYIGNIFADCMAYVEGAEKAAVCASNIDKANGFADKHGFEKRYDDFDKMLAEAEFDIAYIAVPNMMHYEFAMKAIDAGKHVLCEKPMADNLWQLDDMIAKAKEKDVFLMEALWTRCFPAMRKVREWIRGGKIGQLLSVRAEFGIKANEGWQGWKAKAEYAGGAIRDVGIYTLGMAFAGYEGEYPEDIVSSMTEKFGADYHSELFLKYSGGRTAYLTNSFNMVTGHMAVFFGDEGAISCGKVWNPNYAELFTYQGGDEFTRNSVEIFRDDHPSHGMQYEIQHVQDRIAAGYKESDLFPLAESVAICKLTEGLRKEWGVRYSSDDPQG